MLQNWVIRVLLIGILLIKNGKIATTIHAEVNTINKFIELHRKKGYKDSDIRRKLGKQCLIVIRINTKMDRVLTNSAPCSNCVHFLKNNNIQKIIYSLNDGTLQFSRVKELDTTHLSRGQRAMIRQRNGSEV
jgi:hypothetical protein